MIRRSPFAVIAFATSALAVTSPVAAGAQPRDARTTAAEPERVMRVPMPCEHTWAFFLGEPPGALVGFAVPEPRIRALLADLSWLRDAESPIASRVALSMAPARRTELVRKLLTEASPDLAAFPEVDAGVRDELQVELCRRLLSN